MRGVCRKDERSQPRVFFCESKGRRRRSGRFTDSAFAAEYQKAARRDVKTISTSRRVRESKGRPARILLFNLCIRLFDLSTLRPFDSPHLAREPAQRVKAPHLF